MYLNADGKVSWRNCAIMKDLEPNILDDFEHRVMRQIELHQDEPGFPSMDSFGVDKAQLEDYLFDYQAALDSEGTVKSQQVIYGIITILPVVVLSSFPLSMLPWKSDVESVLYGLLIGGGIALLIKVIRVVLKQMKLKNIVAERPDVAAYAKAVIDFANNNK